MFHGKVYAFDQPHRHVNRGAHRDRLHQAQNLESMSLKHNHRLPSQRRQKDAADQVVQPLVSRHQRMAHGDDLRHRLNSAILRGLQITRWTASTLDQTSNLRWVCGKSRPRGCDILRGRHPRQRDRAPLRRTMRRPRSNSQELPTPLTTLQFLRSPQAPSFWRSNPNP